MKFFRKIRSRLLGDRKFGNYLAYAIGEIVLVVIGILIALAINNSNQDRIDREREQVYLAGLRQEFRFSRMKLQELIEVNRQNLEGAKKIMDYMTDPEARPTEQEVSELFYSAFSMDVAFNPNNSLLNEMINSGSLKGVSSDELRIRLTNWISTLDDIAKQEENLAMNREKVVDFFRSDDYSLKTLFDLAGASEELGLPSGNDSWSNLDILESRAFENNVLIFITTTYATGEAHYDPLMKELDKILELIEKELNK